MRLYVRVESIEIDKMELFGEVNLPEILPVFAKAEIGGDLLFFFPRAIVQLVK